MLWASFLSLICCLRASPSILNVTEYMENHFTEVIRKKLCDTLELKEGKKNKDALKADLEKDKKFLENVNKSLHKEKLDDVRVGGNELSKYFCIEI